MEFSSLPEFDKELRRLLKKYRTLEEDLEVLKKILSISSHPNPPQTVRVSGLGIDEPIIVKVKTFACKAMKGKGSRSGIRIIYAYFAEAQQIEFVEIFYKGSRENEDRSRIYQYYRGKSNAG